MEEIVINLSEQQINESWLRMFSSAVGMLLKSIFSGRSAPVKITGSPEYVESFVDVLRREKRHMEAFKTYGLDNPLTYRNKVYLNKAVKNFERKTGLTWPVR